MKSKQKYQNAFNLIPNRSYIECEKEQPDAVNITFPYVLKYV